MNEKKYEEATFAGGCFWCMEPVFDRLDGIISVVAGYTGGHTGAPSYEDVCSGATGHAEAVRIVFDPERIDYSKLLKVFWKNIDPTVKNRQFCDVGTQYRTAIFYHNEEQKKIAEESKKALELSGLTVLTEIAPVSDFYPAEEYHQKFYRKNPGRYHAYHEGCGRDRRLHDLWGKHRINEKGLFFP